MSNLVVIGGQWGDEGKGKIVDLLCPRFDVVARYQGGNNAGHTVKIGSETYALHLLPSGILNNKLCVLGNGMVIDPISLLGEMERLPASCDRTKIRVSSRAHVVMPYHRLLDWAQEQGRDIGTTQKGIGPAYLAKARRSGAIRMIDLLDAKRLRELLSLELPRAIGELHQLVPKELLYEKIGKDLAEFFDEQETLSSSKILSAYVAIGTQLASHITNTTYIVNQATGRILFEGAQGILLDIDHGTFPYVTSSSIARGGVYSGSGYNGSGGEEFLAIVKAYCTRVGGGPFPTELSDDVGERLRAVGHEFGTTTGRPRRCGWLDCFALSYAHLVTRFSAIALTKLDVLSGLETLRICTGYVLDGQRVVEFPEDAAVLARCEPVYEDHPGWTKDITSAKTFEDLPANCRKYVLRIEELTGIPVAIVSVGPERTQTIVRKEL